MTLSSIRHKLERLEATRSRDDGVCGVVVVEDFDHLPELKIRPGCGVLIVGAVCSSYEEWRAAFRPNVSP